MNDSNEKVKKHVEKSGGRHICTLESDEANAFRMYSIHSIKNALTISSRNPNTRYYFRSLTLMEKERERHLNITGSFIIIHPLSIFRLYWECFHVVAIYAGLIVCPINFIFGPLLSNRRVYFGFTPFFTMFEVIFDIIYIADVIMTFFTGYGLYRHPVIHLQLKTIAKKYMSTMEFYFDIVCSISTMSIMTIYYYANPQFDIVNSGMYWSKLLGGIKIFRLIRFIKYLKNVSELLHHYYYLRVLIRYILLIAIGLHWLTCIYIMIVQSFCVYYSRENYVVYSFGFDELLVFDYSYMYLYAQMYIVAYLLGISFTNSYESIFDNRILDNTEMWIFVFYSTIGFVVSNLLMITILQLILSINATEAKYHSIMSQLLSFMHLKTLPNSMKKRFVCYYEYRFQKNYFREATIMGMLSDTLRHDINLYSCRSLIQSVSILRDLPLDIISEVVFHLKHEVYLYNDVIVKAGSVGDCMYFIANGTVAVLTPTGREICHLNDGSYFGEIALISDSQRRIANVVAIEICEVYRLTRAHFDNCFQKNTMFYKKIEQTARERKEKTILLEELHKKYLFDLCVTTSQIHGTGTVLH